MTEPELRRWFGLRDDDPRQVAPAVIEGMRDVPWPITDQQQVAAFRAFLALRLPVF
jgi:hypothetical protein